jgi:hypothetical protein
MHEQAQTSAILLVRMQAQSKSNSKVKLRYRAKKTLKLQSKIGVHEHPCQSMHEQALTSVTLWVRVQAQSISHNPTFQTHLTHMLNCVKNNV